MRIALVNYRYFVSGGPERYMFNIKAVLEAHGHTVMPFSIKNSKNESSEYEHLFLDTIDDSVYFAQSKKSIKTILKSFSRMFYSFEAKRVFRHFLSETKPDIVYAIHFHNKISPSIIDAAKKRKIPVVHRISDFQYMCPSALFYNDAKGVCEDCLHGSSWHCVKYRCVLHSGVYSALKWGAKILHDFLGIAKKVDAFIVPSAFTIQKLREYGIPSKKLHYIPTFFYSQTATPPVEYGDFFLFVGRIEKQKGLMTLVKAFADTEFNLKIIGFSSDGYVDILKQELKGKEHRIEFLGEKVWADIAPYLAACLCTIVPSEWYDNFPNAILESFAYKKSVIATDFGSLPELVKNGETGLCFDYGSAAALRENARWMSENKDEAKRIGENAYKLIETTYSAEEHYKKLMGVFEGAVK